jgi:hypothetical protein
LKTTTLNAAGTVVVLALMAACGGGGGSLAPPPPLPPPPEFDPGGLWVGTITDGESEQSREVVIGLSIATGEFRFVDEEGVQYVGLLEEAGDEVTGTFTAWVPAAGPNDADTLVNGTLAGTLVEQDTLSGTFELETGETGSFELEYDADYERSSSLAKVDGQWRDFFGDVYSVTAGQLTAEFDGCTLIGAFAVIDPARNAYRMSFEIFNCGIYNGDYDGLATVLDLEANNGQVLLYWVNGTNWAFFDVLEKLP